MRSWSCGYVLAQPAAVHASVATIANDVFMRASPGKEFLSAALFLEESEGHEHYQSKRRAAGRKHTVAMTVSGPGDALS